MVRARASAREYTNKYGRARAAATAEERKEEMAAKRRREGRPTKVKLSRADLRVMRESLERLGLESLRAYYASAAWSETKARAHRQGLAEDCYVCGAKWHVHVHHRSYARLGSERLTDLVPLCDRCHLDVHDIVQMEYDNGVTLWNAHIRLKLEGGIKEPEPAPKTFEEMWGATQVAPARKTNPNTWKYRREARPSR